MIRLLAPVAMLWTLLSAPVFAQLRTPDVTEDAAQENKITPSHKEGFVSDKTNKSMANMEIEEITNENFPDLVESFDYPNADVNDLVKAISELTGKNFIVDPNVHGKVSIMAPSRITVAEAYKAFLSALAINGLAVVRGDGFYKIKQARTAQRDRIDTYGGAYYPTSDQMITRIVKLKYISADEVNKQLRIITSKDGEVMAYPPTNSLIISDYGSNIDRVMKILNQLDVQGFEERMEVIRIRYARAKDLADLIEQIIGKGDKSKGGFPGAGAVFHRPGDTSNSSSGAEVYSVVVADDRTNSIIVVGNKAGIDKIRRLVMRLDFRLQLDEQGGVFVYYVQHHEAEQIANTLNNIATESKKALEQTTPGRNSTPPPVSPTGQVGGPSSSAIFGGDVRIAADKLTNSLIITCSAQDYEVLKRILARLDIPRDQVFIKAYIMEMNVSRTNTWSIDYYKFAGSGAGRMGFRGSSSIQDLIDPSNDKGAVIGFGGGGSVTINNNFAGPSTTGAPSNFTVQSIDGLIKLITTNTESNIISTPQIMAINNEEAVIEVGEKVPVANNQQTNGTTITSNVQRENVTTKLTITPHLSPDNDRVKMKVKQEVAGVSPRKVEASELAKNAISTTTRNITTQLVVDNGDTAVLGGLMSDTDNVEETKVPILGDIPLLGWLFKARTTGKVKTNLMVFITPKIVRNPKDNNSVLNQKIDERIEFIQKNLGGRDSHGHYIDDMPRGDKDDYDELPPLTGEEERKEILDAM